MGVRFLGVLAISLTIAGCQTAKHATPSGRAEITMATTADRIKPVMLNDLINMGYQIRQDTPYLLVVDKQTDSFTANLLFGSNWNPVTNTRASFTLAEMSGQTRVVGDLSLVTNPGTGMERIVPLSNTGDSLAIQDWLNTLPAKIGAKATAVAPESGAKRPKKSVF